MTPRAAAASLLILSTMLTGCGRRGSPFSENAGQSEEVEVLSPATLRVGERTVRLADISVPDAAPRARCWAEALLAREAMEVLRAETDYVRDLEILPAGDDPSRARVLVHGRDLSRLLLEQGLAARTMGGWDWCGPMVLDAAGAPRLGYAAPSVPQEARPESAAGVDRAGEEG